MPRPYQSWSARNDAPSIMSGIQRTGGSNAPSFMSDIQYQDPSASAVRNVDNSHALSSPVNNATGSRRLLVAASSLIHTAHRLRLSRGVTPEASADTTSEPRMPPSTLR